MLWRRKRELEGLRERLEDLEIKYNQLAVEVGRMEKDLIEIEHRLRVLSRFFKRLHEEVDGLADRVEELERRRSS